MKESTCDLFLKLLFELAESLEEHQKQDVPQIIVNDIEESLNHVVKAFQLLIADPRQGCEMEVA